MTIQSFSSPEARWAALQSRDPQASSAFIYSVITTKIYCRPNCPSRLARRANIKFHDTAVEAVADGFRPCKRCRPSLKDGEGDPQIIAAEKACLLIRKERGDEEKWAVKSLAKEVGLTESHFCRVFKKITGMTVGEYRTRIHGQPVRRLSKPPPMNSGREEQPLSSVHQLDQGTSYDGVFDGGIFINALSSQLSRDWNTFSSGSTLPGLLESGKSLEDFSFPDYNLSPAEESFNFSTPQPMEDCFQFLNFD